MSFSTVSEDHEVHRHLTGGGSLSGYFLLMIDREEVADIQRTGMHEERRKD